jgi:hypothetical protein
MIKPYRKNKPMKMSELLNAIEVLEDLGNGQTKFAMNFTKQQHAEFEHYRKQLSEIWGRRASATELLTVLVDGYLKYFDEAPRKSKARGNKQKV